MPTNPIDLTPYLSSGATANISGGQSIGLNDVNGVTAIPSFVGISGTATITVTPTIGSCVGTAMVFDFTINQVLVINNTNINCECAGATEGMIDVTVTGGQAPYTYNWGGGITTQDRSFIPAGTYNLTVTDAIGCSITKSITITQPTAIFLFTTQVNTTGGVLGSINLTVSGGVAPYTYKWYNSQELGQTLIATTQDISGLVEDAYYCFVRDSLGCVSRISAYPNDSSNTTFRGVHHIFNNEVIISTRGGTGIKTYLWNDGNTNSTRSILSTGIYSVTVTDGVGATFTISNISVVANPPLVVTLTKTNPTNATSFDGSVTVTFSGGLSSTSDVAIGGGGLSTKLYNVTSPQTFTGLGQGLISVKVDHNELNFNQYFFQNATISLT